MNQVAYSLIALNDERNNITNNETETDLQRIELKVNLILQMLGQMMLVKSSLPEKTRVQLGADEIAWYYPDACIGQNYQVALYLNKDHYLPINMFVRVTSLESGWCHAHIIQQRADEQAAWEHWVFRQHRRTIAIARSQADS